MSIQVVDHADGGKCFLNTETFMYWRIPNLEGKKLFGSNYYDYFLGVDEFLLSNLKQAVVPVFCKSQKKHKKRTIATIISKHQAFDFYNVEMINGYWVNNDTENMIPNNAYYAYIEKSSEAINDFVVRKVKIIERKLH